MYKTNKVLLVNYSKRLHRLHNEVSSLPISCKFHPFVVIAFAPSYCIMTIWCMESRCARFYNSQVFNWVFIHISCNRLLLKVGRAIPLKVTNKENIVDFIQVNIIHWYGVPHYIITNNSKVLLQQYHGQYLCQV